MRTSQQEMDHLSEAMVRLDCSARRRLSLLLASFTSIVHAENYEVKQLLNIFVNWQEPNQWKRHEGYTCRPIIVYLMRGAVIFYEDMLPLLVVYNGCTIQHGKTSVKNQWISDGSVGITIKQSCSLGEENNKNKYWKRKAECQRHRITSNISSGVSLTNDQ
jgi:hypothetical protein